jgi:hypothetical protein
MIQVITPMYWTLQNLKDSENKQKTLHYSSIYSGAVVRGKREDRSCVSISKLSGAGTTENFDARTIWKVLQPHTYGTLVGYIVPKTL